ncbi:MAG: ADP-ribosylglycohydrolase family protein [Erysipelotrichaceae bacterium]|nr:ADP-ribosylglycohydrolase family protein [Erysipelotrichaceae bacterium]
MFGAIIGDIVGSRFEWHNHRDKDFRFFHEKCFFTDDSVMTIAVAKALYESRKNAYKDLEEQLLYWMHEIGRKYPYCGFGRSFYRWIMEGINEPYNSYGNGSAMRTSAYGFFAKDLEEALELSERCAAVSHNHPEGIRGAQATTACIYLAREGKTIDEIGKHVREKFYDIDFTIDGIRETYRFNMTCQDTVPQAIEAFLESDSFEDAIRNAISVGGDSDTLAAICGGIAEAYYGIPDDFREKAESYLDDYLKGIVEGISYSD